MLTAYQKIDICLLTHPKAEPAMVILVPPRRGVTPLTLDVRLALYVYAPDIVDVASSLCVVVTSHDTSPDPSLGSVLQMNPGNGRVGCLFASVPTDGNDGVFVETFV